MDIDNIVVVKSDVSSIDVFKSESKIQFYRDSDTRYEYEHQHVICQPSLDSSGEGAFWKVTIDHMGDDGWIFCGIIGNLNSTNFSHIDSTSYGVTPLGVCRGRSYKNDCDWNGFDQGDYIYFKFKSNKLTMYSVGKDKKFEMDIPRTGNAYIHFNLARDTKVALSSLEEERHKYLL